MPAGRQRCPEPYLYRPSSATRARDGPVPRSVRNRARRREHRHSLEVAHSEPAGRTSTADARSSGSRADRRSPHTDRHRADWRERRPRAARALPSACRACSNRRSGPQSRPGCCACSRRSCRRLGYSRLVNAPAGRTARSRAALLEILVESERNAAATQPAVAARILVQVLLVVILGVVELRRVLDLGRDRTVTGFLQSLAVALQTRLGGSALFGVVDVDARAVLRTDV